MVLEGGTGFIAGRSTERDVVGVCAEFGSTIELMNCDSGSNRPAESLEMFGAAVTGPP